VEVWFVFNCTATKPDARKILFQLRKSGEVGMTREEAISRIENHIRIHSKQEPFRACHIQEALKMAIDALKAQKAEAADAPKPDSDIGCWYDITHNYTLEQVVSALKAQEPRVMTPADVNNIGPEDVCAFIEIREEAHMYACYMHQYDETHTEIMCNVPDMPTKLQNGCARLWTSRPTDEQRKKTPWEGR
jgi:hypothetical protein